VVFPVQRDFQLNDIDKKILDEIKSYFLLNSNEESCGIILSKGGRLIFKPCKNLAIDKRNTFAIDPEIIIMHNTQYIVHSHVNCSARASCNDIKSLKQLKIPYLIYSILYDNFELYDIKSV